MADATPSKAACTWRRFATYYQTTREDIEHAMPLTTTPKAPVVGPKRHEPKVQEADKAPGHEAGAAAGSLWLHLHDADQQPVLGNVFITLGRLGAHGNELRRGFVYLVRHDAYLFKALPAGTYDMQVTAAGFEPLRTRIELTGIPNTKLTFLLQPSQRKDRLILPLQRPHANQQGNSACNVESGTASGWVPSWAQQATDLLRAWHADEELIALAGEPLADSPARGQLQAAVASHLLGLGYPYDANADLRHLFWRLVDARVRLGLTVRRLFTHPLARSVARLPRDVDLTGAVTRALRQIDFLDVHPVALLLAESLEPWRAVLERVVVSQISEFNVTLPPGIAAAMEPRDSLLPTPQPAREPLAADLSAAPNPAQRLNTLALALAHAAIAGQLNTVPAEDGGVGTSLVQTVPLDVPDVSPSTLTILASYQCTAACESCCFGSHPGIHERLSRAQILSAIDSAAVLGSVELVVFSGGECFMLEEDLVIAVAHCTMRGLASRCVTNGYWAKTPEAALERLTPLRNAGLRELNLSTGDFHQAYVDIESIIHAAVAGVSLGMRVVVVVESRGGRAYNGHQLLRDPRMADIARSPLLTVFDSPWMPMQERTGITQSSAALADTRNLFRRPPCDSVLDTLVVNPSGVIGACCGLTREQIPELSVGDVSTGLGAAVRAANLDFMKIWISVDGPERILAWAAGIDRRIDWEQRYSHHCDACRAVYDDPLVREVIVGHWRYREPDVMQRHALMQAGNRPFPESRPKAPDSINLKL